MRKNHHGKNDRLVKRVFALCLALAVICTCLVPVFATEASGILQPEQEASRPVEGGEEEAAGPDGDFPAVDDSEAAGFGEEEASRPVDGEGGEKEAAYPDEDEAAGFGEDEASRPVDGEGGEKEAAYPDEDEAAGFGEDEASRPVDGEGGEDNPGEDAVVDKNEEVVSGDEIKKQQDMVVYRFWLKELNALDLQDIAMQAQTDNMTESEYLAQRTARNCGTCTSFRLCPGQRPLQTTAATSRTPPPTGTPRANCGSLTTGTRWTSLATGCA